MYKVLLTLILALSIQNAHAQGVMAPAFTLADANGEEITLPLTHDGVDIYLFWASWCPYCKALMLELEDMLVEYSEDLTVYALNIRDEEDPAKFMDERGYDFVLLPKADPVMELYGVKPVPALFVVDGSGRIRFNLYRMEFEDDDAYMTLNASEKAGVRAPAWAAAIRRSIDKILKEQAAD